MKIVWLAPYPAQKLLPELKVKRLISAHAMSWILNLSEVLSINKDNELHFVTGMPGIKKEQTINKFNIVFHVIPHNFPFTFRGFPYYCRLDILGWHRIITKKISKCIKSINPDIIHIHGAESYYALAGLRSHFPAVISIQGIIHELIHVEFVFSSLFQLPLENYVIKKHEHFGCRTEWDKHFVSSINKNAIIHYMPEAINNVFFETEWNHLNAEEIVFVGSLLKRKGPDVLINALGVVSRDFPHIKLKLIGSGTKRYRRFLGKLIRKHGLFRNIQFAGNLGPSEIAEHLSMARIFVLPTLIDNSPNSLAEAMAVGVPCIASNVGGIASMITHGHDGLLVPPNDPTKLAEAILSLLSDNRIQKKLSSNARQTAIKRNYPDTVGKITEKVYKTIIKTK